jgi:hypothetical protein
VGISTRPPAPKSAPLGRSFEQKRLDSGWYHIIHRVRLIKPRSTPAPAPTSPDPVKRTKQQAASATSQCKTARPEVPVVETKHLLPSTLTRIFHSIESPICRDNSRSSWQFSYRGLCRFVSPWDCSFSLRRTKKTTVFSDVAPWSLVETYRRFRGASGSDDGGSNHIWNIGQFLPDKTLKYSRRQSFRLAVLFQPPPPSQKGKLLREVS